MAVFHTRGRVLKPLDVPSNTPVGGLGSSARKALLWSGGVTLIQDVAQFGVMLVLVRLLTPAEYGAAALAQSLMALTATISYQAFSLHALQHRNPDGIDWQSHFTAAIGVNAIASIVTLAIAAGLLMTETYRAAAFPLTALTFVFCVDVMSSIRSRMLESAHDWVRLRVLLLSGALAGLVCGLVVATLGGGVWALVMQPIVAGIPLAIDLFLNGRFRPDWGWSWARWQLTFRFGLDRIAASLVWRARATIEQLLLSGFYGMAALGAYTRAFGLAGILSGRIGAMATTALHPVLTRAEAGSVQFNRLAGLVLRGIVWTTFPAVALLVLAAQDVVMLLYGDGWLGVVELLPLAALSIALSGLITSTANLLVANQQSRKGMILEAIGAITSILVAVTLLPFGINVYLVGLILHGLIVTGAALVLVLRYGVVTPGGVMAAIVPAGIAVALGMSAVIVSRRAAGVSDYLFYRLIVDACVLAVIYVSTLRALFPMHLRELLRGAPGGDRLTRLARLTV